jgi:hypothetical protein
MLELDAELMPRGEHRMLGNELTAVADLPMGAYM